MDHLSPFLHRQPRYAPIPPPPAPPPAPRLHHPPFHDNPNFYAPHHNHNHNHLPPPPPPPPLAPAPAPSYRAPPPPPYNSHQSQFTFRNPNNRPIEDNPRSHRIDFNPTPRVFDDDRHRHHHAPEFDRPYVESRTDVWNPPRVHPENRTIRVYPVLDLDHESRHRPFDHHHHHRPVSPYRAIDKFRHDSEGSSSRFRDDFSDGFLQNQKEEIVWGRNEGRDHDGHRGHIISSPSKPSRNFGFGSSSVSHSKQSSRDFAENLGNYESRYDSEFDDELFMKGRGDGVSENHRWVHSRQPPREVPSSSVEMGINEFGDGDDEVRVSAGKRVPHVSELARFNSRGSRESNQEYDRAPWKQLQKKSAFLRIQYGKPNYRNKSDEQLLAYGYFDDANTSSFRGKDTIVYSDRRTEEEGGGEREGSPVELDVSFKSNSLVAKAIVAPSSPAVGSDKKLTPRNRRIRELMVPDTGTSSPQRTKLSEGPVKLDSSTPIADNPSSSGKDPKQSDEKVPVSSSETAHDVRSKPSSNGAHVSLVKRTVERSPKATVSNKDGTNVGSDGKSLPKVMKKKKIVKKVTRLSSSQPVKKHVGPLTADKSMHGPSAASRADKGLIHSKEEATSTGTVSGQDVVLQPCSKEVTMLPERNKLDGSPQALVSEKGATDVEFGMACLPKIMRKRNSSTPFLGLSSPEETKNNEDPVDAALSVHGFHAISNSDNGLIVLQDSTTFPDIGSVDDVSKQSLQNGISVSLGNGAPKESAEVMFSGGNGNVGFSSTVENKIHEDPKNTHSCDDGMNNVSSSDHGLIKYVEKNTVSDIDAVDADSKQSCPNEVTISLENGMVEGSLKAISEVGGNVIVGLPSSEENIIHDGPINVDSFNHGTGAALSSDNGLTISQDNNTVHNNGSMDDIGEHPSPNGVDISIENDAISKGSPKATVSVAGDIIVGFIKECTPKIKKKKRKDRTLRLNSSDSSITDKYVGPVSVVSSANGVDTTLSCSVEDSSPTDKEVTVSGVGNLGVSPQICTDGVNILQGNTSMEGFSEDMVSVRDGNNVSPNGTSHKHKKKRKGLSTQCEIGEGPMVADNSTSGPEVASNSNNGITRTGEEAALSNIATAWTADLPPGIDGTIALCENCVAGGYGAMGSVRDGFSDDCLNLEHRGIDSSSFVEESAIPNVMVPYPSAFGCEQTENVTSVTTTTDHRDDIMDIYSSRGEKIEVPAAEGHVMSETDQCRIPLEFQTPDSDQILHSTDMECDSYLLVKDDLPSTSSHISLSVHGDGVFTTNFNDELTESVPDTPSNMGSPETLSIVPDIDMLRSDLSHGQISDKMVSGDDKRLEEKPMVEVSSDLHAHNSSLKNTKINLNSDHATESDHSLTKKAVPLVSHDTKNATNSVNPMSEELKGRKNQPSFTVSRMFPNRSFIGYTNSKKTASSTQIAKPRTWHRTGNPSACPLPGKKSFSNAVPPQRQFSRKIGKVQSTSYIRKGNSLVRKPAPVAALPQGSHSLSSSACRLNLSGKDEVKKSMGSSHVVDMTDPLNLLRTEGMNAAFEKPRTPPLPHSTKLPNCAAISSETTSDPMNLMDENDVPKSSEDAPKFSETPENQTGPIKSSESQTVLNDGNLVSSKMKNIMYVKRKSNQLVAAPNPCDLSVHNVDNNEALSSDGYCKRRKNQLIRTSLDSCIKQQVAIPDDSLNSEGQRASIVISSRTSSKRRSDKVVGTTFKPSKFSLVWTLHGTQSSKIVSNSLQRQKVLPQLFPWKRATYWRSFMQNSASIPNSFSMISRKLLLSRKRDAVYTRSTHGLSLRKSKVLSVGGSSLKWSKSIEKRSKKANEEATLAVAAAERKRREQNSAASVIAGAKTRNYSFRERIFRIGSIRYKMDSSKRTLQRISDDESSCPAALKKKDAKKSYVPRRLVIGNDEYVRIGNGNQLIRDPKKRIRTLASEKVRWSLHTARLRLARKRKYCQFFTRFGKCNKDDGKCPYIHDPSKIAVCTKFLNGLCSNPNCKLTHKVIPERMQDCSYFLQGLCSNENCPYRHVNVNPNASTCEGFLRGYCADGNECRKKHSYVCPDFEATGICPQGSKCKLHHPKNRSIGKKRKRSREQKNAQGRYFGSTHANAAEFGAVVVSEKHSAQNDEDILFQGSLADYISLDVSDEEAGETFDPTSNETTFGDCYSSDSQLDDLERLIKPIRIMISNLAT